MTTQTLAYSTYTAPEGLESYPRLPLVEEQAFEIASSGYANEWM
jgi:hypothetical protein